MRLKDADALIEAWRKKHNIGEDDCGAVFVGYTEIPRLIDEQPTVDAVPVVRCKDCKYKNLSDICERFEVNAGDYTFWHHVEDNDFCSRAERRRDV